MEESSRHLKDKVTDITFHRGAAHEEWQATESGQDCDRRLFEEAIANLSRFIAHDSGYAIHHNAVVEYLRD